MMKRIVAIMLAAFMLLPLLPLHADADTLPFKDINSSAWYYKDISYIYSNGIMLGTSGTAFSPNQPLSRAMLITTLWRIAGEPENSKNVTFHDVLSNSWYSDAIAWAQETGLAKGYEDNSFRPNQSITRQELASFIYRYAQYKKQDTKLAAALEPYSDSTAVGNWAKDAVRWVLAVRIMVGKDNNKLDPKGNATRAEAAAILKRFVAPDNEGYAQMLRNAISLRDKADSSFGEGMLYDIDGNGTEELIIVHSAMRNGAPHVVCSVYTLQNGKVITLIDKLALFVLAGGTRGYAGIVKRNGKTCFAATWEESFPDSGDGEWHLYTLMDAVISLHAKTVYEYKRGNDNHEILYSQSWAKVNGEKISYQTWVDSITTVQYVDGRNSSGDGGLSLEYLLNKV